MPTDLMVALGATGLGLVLSRLARPRWVGVCLLIFGLGASLWLGRMHILEPSDFARKARALPADQVRALDWVRSQLVSGETVLTDFEEPILPESRVSPSILKAFWETGWVDLLNQETSFLVFDRTRVSKRFLAGLNKRWVRLGPSYGPIQPCEILLIPRTAALSQPPFRTSLSLPQGPYQPGQVVTFKLEAYNATNETRRLGWVEVRVDGKSFRRLAGYNPLPARSGEVVELVFVAPEKPGGYQVTVTMPNTATGEPEMLKRKPIRVH